MHTKGEYLSVKTFKILSCGIGRLLGNRFNTEKRATIDIRETQMIKRGKGQ